MDTDAQQQIARLWRAIESKQIEIEALRTLCQAAVFVLSEYPGTNLALLEKLDKVMEAGEASALNTAVTDEYLERRREAVGSLLGPQLLQTLQIARQRRQR